MKLAVKTLAVVLDVADLLIKSEITEKSSVNYSESESLEINFSDSAAEHSITVTIENDEKVVKVDEATDW